MTNKTYWKIICHGNKSNYETFIHVVKGKIHFMKLTKNTNSERSTWGRDSQTIGEGEWESIKLRKKVITKKNK